MEDSKQISQHGSVEDERARALVDQDPSSMTQDDESQDLNGSEGCVVDPTDVIAIREIQDDSTELSSDEMQFPEKDIVYEFPRDSEDADSNIARIDFFDPQTNAREGHLTVQVNASAESAGKERGRIVEVETCEVHQEAMSSARPNKNDNGKPGREQKQVDKRVTEKRSESSQQILTASSSSSVEDSRPDFTPKRQKLNTAFLVNICREHSDEGHLADVEDSSSSSSCNEMEDTPEIAPPSMNRTSATVIPKYDINCSKGVPAVATSLIPSNQGERSCGHEHKPSPAKLFKEPRPVKKSKPSTTCASSKDSKDKMTSRKNIVFNDGRGHPKRAKEAKPQTMASTSFVSDVYEDVQILMTNENSSDTKDKTASRKNIVFNDGRGHPKRAQEAKPQVMEITSFVSDVYEDVQILMTNGNSSDTKDKTTSRKNIGCNDGRSHPKRSQEVKPQVMERTSSVSDVYDDVQVLMTNRNSSDSKDKTTSRKNIGYSDSRGHPKIAQEAKPQAMERTSFVSDVYDDVEVLMTNGNNSESGSVDAARTDAQEAEKQVVSSTSSPSGCTKMKTCISSKNRCNECNTRLGLCAIRCRCGNQYCAKHRYDKAHNCTFDYRAMGAEEIRRNNPRVVAEKVRKL